MKTKRREQLCAVFLAALTAKMGFFYSFNV